MRDDRVSEFEEFVVAVEPRLRRALVGCRGIDLAHDAVAEALAYAWEHWERVQSMENPVGYLFRVGQSKTRRRAVPPLPRPEEVGISNIEPALVPALMTLSLKQRTAVWLVHGCEWSYAETAAAMSISPSAVGTHVSRALAHLKEALEVDTRA